MNPLIITHKNCVDGCCCKAIFRSKFGNNATYLELDHANLEITKDKDAQNYIDLIFSFYISVFYFADFCLKSEFISKLLDQHNKVVILDHHETSIQYVEPFEKRMANGEKLKLEIHFAKTNEFSGSMLTWNYLYPNIEPTKTIKYVSDGDIWKFEFGNTTKYFYTGLMESFGEPSKIPNNIWDNLIFDNSVCEEFVKIGEPIHSIYMQEVMSYVQLSKAIRINNIDGYLVKAPKKYTSDLGNQLAKLTDGKGFGLVYNINEETNVVNCSLRSIAPIKVNDIAKKFDGGGHAQASAFRCKNMEQLKDLLISEGNNIFNKMCNKI